MVVKRKIIILLYIGIISFLLFGCLDSYKNLKISYYDFDLNKLIKQDTINIINTYYSAEIYGIMIGQDQNDKNISEINIILDIKPNKKMSIFLNSVLITDTLKNIYESAIYFNKNLTNDLQLILEPNKINNIVFYFNSDKSKIKLPLSFKIDKLYDVDTKKEYSIGPISVNSL